MGRTFLGIDMARAADLLGMERRQAEAFRDLETGHFMALGPALSRHPLRLRIGTTETEPRNAMPRLMPLPEAAMEDARAVILAAPPPEAARPQRRPPAPPPPDLLSQLIAAKPVAIGNRAEAVEEPPNGGATGGDRRSGWTASCAPSWRNPGGVSGHRRAVPRISWFAAGSRVWVPGRWTWAPSAAC